MSQSNNLSDADSFAKLYAVATRSKTGQPDKNEDAVACLVNEAGLRVVVVADGIGSHSYARVASSFIAEQAISIIKDLRSVDRTVLGGVFQDLHRQLLEKARVYLEEGEFEAIDRERSFGTTLIVAIETECSFLIAYTGNGGVWHIRGNFDHFHSSRLFPWSAINHLNPHTNEEGGREILYRHFSLSDNSLRTTPTILELSKDEHYGDILVICTDGIYSSDQVRVGRDSSSQTWIEADVTIISLFDTLKFFLRSPSADLTATTLQTRLEEYLLNLDQKKVIEDDASVGVIITSKALSLRDRNR